MSLKIDPTSVHLGKNAAGAVDNVYVADYLASPDPQAGDACAPTPLSKYTPGDPTLIPLIPSCGYDFNVFGIPPTPPPPTLLVPKSCETLTATSRVKTTDATKNSYVNLVASGPLTSDLGISDCSLDLDVFLDVNACLDFKATSSVKFSNAASGSTLKITNAGIPNCGFDISGDITITACEEFTTTSNIVYGSAMKGSSLVFTPRGQPNCGLDITGAFNSIACESFDAVSQLSISGRGVKKSDIGLTAVGTPNCGFALTGDVVIDACPSITGEGTINFHGLAVANQRVQITSSDCGFVLSGDVEIDACADFYAVSNLRIAGNVVKPIKPLKIVYTSTPNCGFTLDGELQIDACSEVTLELGPDPKIPQGSITLFSGVEEGEDPTSGTPVASAPLILNGSVTMDSDGCGGSISLQMESINLAVPGCCPVVAPDMPPVLSGCMWDQDVDNIHLEKDESTGEIYIGGTLPKPCFVCYPPPFVTLDGLTPPFVYTNLELSYLSVDWLEASPCCTSSSYNKISLCDGVIQFQHPDGKTITATAENVQLTSDGLQSTTMFAAELYLADQYNSTELKTTSLLISETSVDNTYVYATARGLYYSDGAVSLTSSLSAEKLAFTDASATNSTVDADGLWVASCAGEYLKAGYDQVYLTAGEGLTYSKLTADMLSISDGTYSSLLDNNSITFKAPGNLTFAYYGSDQVFITNDTSGCTYTSAEAVKVSKDTDFTVMTPQLIGAYAANTSTVVTDVGWSISGVDDITNCAATDSLIQLYNSSTKNKAVLTADELYLAVNNNAFTRLQNDGKMYVQIMTGNTPYGVYFDFTGGCGYGGGTPPTLVLKEIAVCVGNTYKSAWVFMKP